MENKNFIIAIVASVAIMFLWSEFFAPKPEKSVQKTVKTSLISNKKKEMKSSKSENSDSISNSASVAMSQKNYPEKTGVMSNGFLKLSYSSKQGKISKILVIEKKYASKKLDLLSAKKEQSIFPETPLLFSKEPNYQVLNSSKNSVTFLYENGGLKIQKKISLGKNYEINVEKTIENNSGKDIKLSPKIKFDSLLEKEGLFNSYKQKFDIFVGYEPNEDSHIEDNKDVVKFVKQNKKINWASINYAYFTFAFVNKKDKFVLSNKTSFSPSENHVSLVLNYAKAKKVVHNNEKATFKFTVYAGPKDISKMEMLGCGLEKTVNFGWSSFLAKPLLFALKFLYKFIGNYGVAIILLTFLIKLLMLPLSTASFKSMNKMKLLTPKLNELKEKYKNDKDALNRETMKLYQKEGVNPLGGCLPMLIQFPIYIALYYMIKNSVVLYNAPFLPFWLTDLSAKDPYYIIPVSLGILMFLQQKMMPQQMDNKQAKIMMYTMPVIFTWISLYLPSGLTVYWFVNTLLGVAQQIYINKKYS